MQISFALARNRAFLAYANALGGETKNRRVFSNVQLDHLIRNDIARDDSSSLILSDGFYGIVARELVAYNPRGECFRRGTDAFDQYRDKEGRKRIIPASYLEDAHKKQAFFDEPNVALLIDPKSIETSRNGVNMAILPESITVVRNFIQGFHVLGKVDLATRLPIYASQEELQSISESDKRWSFTMPGNCIREILMAVPDGDLGFNQGRNVMMDFPWAQEHYAVYHEVAARAENRAVSPRQPVPEAVEIQPALRI